MSDVGNSILKRALEDQAAQWFETAADLTTAANAIKREAETGHMYLDTPLSPDQLTQRKQILNIAHAVIESARRRALENFYGSLQSRDNQCLQAGDLTTQDGSAKSPENLKQSSNGSIQVEQICSESPSGLLSLQ